MMFIFGDLNYRIALPNDVVRPAVARRDFDLLKKHDEMIQSFMKYGSDSAETEAIGMH